MRIIRVTFFCLAAVCIACGASIHAHRTKMVSDERRRRHLHTEVWVAPTRQPKSTPFLLIRTPYGTAISIRRVWSPVCRN